ncbi:MAG: hypothetical protein U0Q15_05460 [Kineosporiaceae bacterium]
MNRRTFDALLTVAGAVLALVLVVAGGLLTWASSFIGNEVHDQLAAQQIFFPAKGSDQLKSDKIGPYINQYAGQQLTTGAQAKAYADHYIAVHLEEMTGGKTYSQLSTESRQDPNNAEKAQLVQTAFRGETLRGLLLNAYAFGTMGTIAGIAAWVSFGAAGALLVLVGLGLVHRRRTAPGAQLGGAHEAIEAVTV